MSIPLRVKDTLFREAEAEGSLLSRSASKQVEFWAELGKRVAGSLTPDDVLALMQGIARVRVDMSASQPIDAKSVFGAVDKAGLTEKSGWEITKGALYYEVSKNRPGLLDQVLPDGTRQAGRFLDGAFRPE